MRIAVAGTGYVGLSIALLLAQHNDVHALDIIPEKVSMLNQGKSPIVDKEISAFLNGNTSGEHPLQFQATLDPAQAYTDADFAVVATPTNYDPQRNYFDTSSVEAAIAAIRQHNKTAWIVIKSTIPVGYTTKLREQLHDHRILFSPEFLREGHALYDNLHPSRIVVGAPQDDAEAVTAAHAFVHLLAAGADPKEQNVLTLTVQLVFQNWSLAPLKQKLSNCSPIPILHYASLTLTNLTLMQKAAISTLAKSFKAYVSILAFETTTITLVSDTAATAYPKILSSYSPTTTKCRKTSSRQSSTRIARVKTSLPQKSKNVWLELISLL